MVKIRLKRTGKKNSPCYRIIVADSRSPRDGKNIEVIGFYDPINAQERLDVERADYWVSNGAQPTSTVADIIRRAKTGESTSGKKSEIRENAAKAAAEATAKAEAEAAAEKKAAESAEAAATEETAETSEG